MTGMLGTDVPSGFPQMRNEPTGGTDTVLERTEVDVDEGVAVEVDLATVVGSDEAVVLVRAGETHASTSISTRMRYRLPL